MSGGGEAQVQQVLSKLVFMCFAFGEFKILELRSGKVA
jgi:hypothetical protein